MRRARHHPIWAIVIALGLSVVVSVAVVSIPMRRGGLSQGLPVDPGPRTTVNLFTFSQPFASLSATEFRNFGCPDGTIGSCASNTTSGAQGIFNLQWSVTGSVAGQTEAGLGPRYNANACFWCHASPVPGGSSPSSNAEIAMQGLNARPGFNANAVPSANYFAPDGSDGQPFIRGAGPTRLAMQRSTGTRLPLYTIGGTGGAMMTDIAGLSSCTSGVVPQPDFSTLLGANDISPLIPPPLFGEGLIEATPDANWRSQQNATKFAAYGIPLNTFNLNSFGMVSKIGWKGDLTAVNGFTSTALAIEVGASTEAFPMKVNAVPACDPGTGLPDDHAALVSRGTCSGCSMDWASAVEGDTYFATHLESPEPAWGTAAGAYDGPPPGGWSGSGTTAYTTATATVTQGSVYNGYQQFLAAGCDTCHSPSHTTGPSAITGLGSKTYYNYSDRALHHMGVGINNGISAGLASGDQFRTADLWGVGQRLWFNHDGRTKDLYAAIALAHCTTGSEASAVCSAFGTLTLSNQQDLLNFLRGL